MTVSGSKLSPKCQILGKDRLAARWFKRAAEHGDGDALVDWGYCLQNGIGVRKNQRAAEEAFRSAIDSSEITDNSREEAMYYLAILLLRRQSACSRPAAVRLLRRANMDGDYPQAQVVLRSVGSINFRNVCLCRRHLRSTLAKKSCPLHRPHKANKGLSSTAR